VKIDGQLRPVSRASANPAAEKVSKAIETINKNKITRQPLTDSNANASKRTSIESKRQSMDENKRQSIGPSTRNSVDFSNRNSVDYQNKRNSLDVTKRSSVDVRNKRHSVDVTNHRSEIHNTEEQRPASMAQVQVRGGPPKPFAVTESAGYTPQRNSMLDVQTAGITQHRNSMLDVDIRGGPQKAMAVMESAGLSKEQAASQPNPLTMHPVQTRGGPQKAMAVMESARQARETSVPSAPQPEQLTPVEVRGGPEKQSAVLASARHARDGSRSSIASNRHSVGDVAQLMERNDAANAAKRMSHPPLGARRSFSDGSTPAEQQTEQPATPLGRKPSGRKTAERLAWIRELEEGNKTNGNHGRDYMFNKLQGGVRDKLAKFENKQLTGGLARTDSNISRRLSTSSDAYSIEQPALNRLSRTATIDDDFRKKLEESVTNQHKKRIIPQEVLDLVALTDGDQEAALNDFMQNWNQDELIKQINDAADQAINEEKTREATKSGETSAESKMTEPAKDVRSNDFDPFGPGADLSLGMPNEKKKSDVSVPVSLPKVPTSELPKASRTWNPKPTLRSQPMGNTSNGAKTMSIPASSTLPAAKPSWNPKVPSKGSEPEQAKPTPKEAPTPTPALAKVPTSLLLGSNAPASSWNPKPSSTWNPKPSSTWNPKPSAKPVSKPEEPKTAPKESTVPVASSSPATLSMRNGVSTSGTFTAAALPKFVAA
jgi:hypothetical protein